MSSLLLRWFRRGQSRMGRAFLQSAWVVLALLAVFTFGAAARAEVKTEGRLFVISVGINNYPQLGAEYQLKGCVGDAEALVKAFQKSVSSPAQTTTLMDAKATRANIIATFKNVAKQAQPEDAVVFFFAGHSTTAGDKGLSLLPCDADKEKADKDLDAPTLAALLQSIPARNQLVLLDATAGSSKKLQEFLRVAVGANLSPDERELSERSVTVIAPALSAEEAADSETHGFLTLGLLRALSREADADNNGSVTLGEFVRSARAYYEKNNEMDSPLYVEQKLLADAGNFPLVHVNTVPPVPLPPPPPPLPTATEAIPKSVDLSSPLVQKRVALVIGNSSYENAPLKNPVNDARAMADTLKELGFTVFLKTNLTNGQMDVAVDQFAAELGPDTVGLFYFSGYGVQVEGVNYLVPTGYVINRQADIPFEMFSVQRLLDTLKVSGCKSNIVILDACRDSPLLTSIRAIGDKGLGGMYVLPPGTFIALANAPGQTASDDGMRSNSLFTGQLLQKMKTPGLTIEDVFKATETSVRRASAGRQTPSGTTTLHNKFYFAPDALPTAAAPPPTVTEPPKHGVVETDGIVETPRGATGNVPPAPEPAVKGRNYALLVGCSDYNDMGFKHLPNPVVDVEQLAKTLRENYHYAADDVQVLKNPSYAQLLKALKAWKLHHFETGDQLLLYFAGHGDFDGDVGDGFLVCKDSIKDAQLGEARTLQYGNLRAIADNLPCRHVFVVLDACFAGSFDLNLAQEAERGPGEKDTTLARDPAEYIRRKMPRRSRKMLASGRLISVSDGKPGEGSPFVRRLQEILIDRADRGKLLTFNELTAALEGTDPEPHFGDFGRRDPGGDFVFLP